MKTFSRLDETLYEQATNAIVIKIKENCYKIPDEDDLYIYTANTDSRIGYVDQYRFYSDNGYRYDFYYAFKKNPIKFFKIIDWLKSGKCKKVKNPFM